MCESCAGDYRVPSCDMGSRGIFWWYGVYLGILGWMRSQAGSFHGFPEGFWRGGITWFSLQACLMIRVLLTEHGTGHANPPSDLLYRSDLLGNYFSHLPAYWHPYLRVIWKPSQ